jgi:hypothetical protein
MERSPARVNVVREIVINGSQLVDDGRDFCDMIRLGNPPGKPVIVIPRRTASE